MKNKHIFKNSLILVIVMSIILSIPLSVHGHSSTAPTDDIDYFIQIKDLIQKNYVYDITEEQLIEGGLKGLFYNLDENSNYYTKEEFQELIEDISGDFVGIGVYVKEENGYIVITAPIEGSPAHKAGIKPGDKVIAVDGKDVRGLSIEEVIDLIKGETGTKVGLSVQRGQQKPLSFKVTRQEIKINPIEYKILKGKIGYIKISQFNQYTYENLLPVLTKLDKDNISNIIVDLRDNPGGFLTEVIEILKLFVSEGPIVHIQYNGKIQETYYSNLKKPKHNLVVLVNENSASASEIFAGAVQDRKAGTIVGVTTYGKGTVQQVVPLPNGDGMKLTIAEYLTPNKRNINNKGIKPDIIVEDKEGATDQQLKKALELLTK